MLVHELPEQSGMVLLFADEQLDDSRQRLGAVRSLEALGGLQQRAALGLFAELEGGDRIRDQASLVCREPLTVAPGQGRAPTGVIEEVIESDLQIGLHRESPRLGVPA